MDVSVLQRCNNLDEYAQALRQNAITTRAQRGHVVRFPELQLELPLDEIYEAVEMIE